VTKCPCCGQETPSERLLVNLDTNIAAYDGIEIEIRPPQAAELVYILAEAWPKTASLFKISQAIWGMHEPEGAVASIRVHVSMARKQLERLGFGIEAIVGRGYRLVAPNQSPATQWQIDRRECA
jgi:DNA-binding response OmpR family regulator